VKLCLHLEGKGKRVPGIHGKCIGKLLMHLKAFVLMKETSDSVMAALEWLVVLFYDRTSDILKVNEVRKKLFTQKSRSLENIPPIYAVVLKELNRASYQAYCWNEAYVHNPDIPNPSDWG